MITILASLILTYTFAAEVAKSGAFEEADGSSAASTLYSSADPIQKCLDDVRLRKIETQRENKRKEAEEAKKREQGSPVENPYKFDLVNQDQLPNECPEGNLENFKSALKRQIENCKKPARPKFAAPMRLGCRLVEREDYCLKSNERLLELANQFSKDSDFPALMNAAKKEFDWYKSRGMLDDRSSNFPKGTFQFTGFYAPEPIEARLKPEGDFVYPIYRKPDDLVDFSENHKGSCGIDPISQEAIEVCRKTEEGKLVPYYTRKEIDMDKKLSGKGYEIAYVKDPIDIAFLAIQGDGTVNVKGKLIRLNFASKNGRPSSLLGSVVICAGGKAGGMESIREYLQQQSDRKRFELMNYDKSFIFFKVGSGGPLGVEDIEMTPMHTLATDLKLVRTGSVMLFNSPRPKIQSRAQKGENAAEKSARLARDAKENSNACGQTMTSLAISQDTGGAILNVHADIYMGEGKRAGQLADSMNSPGSLFVGVLKGAGQPVKGCKP